MCNIDKDKCPYYLKSSQKQKNRRLRTLKEKSAKDMNKLHRGKKIKCFSHRKVCSTFLFTRDVHMKTLGYHVLIRLVKLQEVTNIYLVRLQEQALSDVASGSVN